MDKKIEDHLIRLNKYYLELKKLQNQDKAEFINNSILTNASERLFQLAIESCINIGNRILSIEQFSKSIKSPETYADIFIELNKIKVIDDNFAENLKRMVKFRNRLVHLYWETDPNEIYDYLQNNIEDFPKFISKVLEYYG